MNVETTQRGFEVIDHPVYTKPEKTSRLVQQSSAVGHQDGAFDHPGSSFLWVGSDHHLNRNEVRELVAHLQSWLNTGSLATEVPAR